MIKDNLQFYTKYTPKQCNIQQTLLSNRIQTQTRKQMIEEMIELDMGWMPFGEGHIRNAHAAYQSILKALYHEQHYENVVTYHYTDLAKDQMKREIYWCPGHPLHQKMCIHYTDTKTLTLAPCGDDIKCPKMHSTLKYQMFFSLQGTHLHHNLASSSFSGIIVAKYPKKSTNEEAQQLIHAAMDQLEDDQWQQLWFWTDKHKCNVLIDYDLLPYADWVFTNDALANTTSCLSSYRFPYLCKFTANSAWPQQMRFPQDFTFENYTKFHTKQQMLDIYNDKQNMLNENYDNSNNNNENSNDNNEINNEVKDELIAWGINQTVFAEVMHQQVRDYVTEQEETLNKQCDDYDKFIDHIKLVAKEGFHHGHVGRVYRSIYNHPNVEECHAYWSETNRIFTDLLKMQIRTFGDNVNVILESVEEVYGDGMFYEQMKINGPIIKRAQNESPKLNWNLPGRKIMQSHNKLNYYICELDKHIHEKYGKNKQLLYAMPQLFDIIHQIESLDQNNNQNNNDNNENFNNNSENLIILDDIDMIDDNDNIHNNRSNMIDLDDISIYTGVDSDNENNDDNDNDDNEINLDDISIYTGVDSENDKYSDYDDNNEPNVINLDEIDIYTGSESDDSENSNDNNENLENNRENPIIIEDCNDYTHVVISEFKQARKERINIKDDNDVQFMKCIFNLATIWRYGFLIRNLFRKMFMCYIDPKNRQQGINMFNRGIKIATMSFWMTRKVALWHFYPYHIRNCFVLPYCALMNYLRLKNGRFGLNSQYAEKDGKEIKMICNMYSSSRADFADRINEALILKRDYQLMLGFVDLFAIYNQKDREPKLWIDNKTQFDIQKQFNDCSLTLQYAIRTLEHATQKQEETLELQLLMNFKISNDEAKIMRNDVSNHYDKFDYDNKEWDDSDSESDNENNQNLDENNENSNENNENSNENNENNNNNNNNSQRIEGRYTWANFNL